MSERIASHLEIQLPQMPSSPGVARRHTTSFLETRRREDLTHHLADVLGR